MVTQVRIWGNYVSDPNDYLTSAHILAEPALTHDAGERIKDRLGLIHRIRPSGRRHPVELKLHIPTRLCEMLACESADPRRRLSEWLDYHVNEQGNALTVFALKEATDSDGESFIEKRWYYGEVESLPDWLSGTRTGLNPTMPIPAVLTVLLNITAAGRFVDFDSSPQKVWSITGVSTGSDTFTIAGDYTAAFCAGTLFLVDGSAGNDGWWTVESSEYTGGNTVITVTGDITDATVDGSILNRGEYERS